MFNEIFIWINRFREAGLLGFCFLLFESFFLQIGETNTFSRVEECIESEKEVLFLQGARNDLLEIKYRSVQKIKPEILITGSSRVNMFRSKMFDPYSFYNLSNVVTNFSRTVGVINGLETDELPRVIFVLVEPQFFRNDNSSLNTTKVDIEIKPKDIAYKNNRATIGFMKRINNRYIKTPHLKNLGLKAVFKNRGFRTSDGSANWGEKRFNTKEQRIFNIKLSEDMALTKANKNVFLRFDTPLSEVTFDEYKVLAETCKQKGIVLIGVTPPIGRPMQKVFDSDVEKYQIWHEFQMESTGDRLREIGDFYFNFSRFSASESNYYEMYDHTHPSEKIIARMFLKMLEDPAFQKLFPKIDIVAIQKRIESSNLPCIDIFSGDQ